MKDKYKLIVTGDDGYHCDDDDKYLELTQEEARIIIAFIVVCKLQCNLKLISMDNIKYDTLFND